MSRKLPFFVFSVIAFLVARGSAEAQQPNVLLPAGTLLTCTLSEPNFSPVTADIGDPVLCQADILRQIGRTLPRGTYLVGHLVNERQPGHFAGKGSMTITFDRISISNTELPLSGKVIAVKGYNVTREETIMGRGHAKRDAAEWMIPVLWPWKVISLPARGPEPVLKGEVRVTLRIMDDLLSAQLIASSKSDTRYAAQTLSSYSTTANMPATRDSYPTQVAPEPRQTNGPHLTFLAFRGGAVYAATDYWLMDDDRSLAYVLANGAKRRVDLGQLDWKITTQLNKPGGIMIRPRSESTHSF